MRKLYVMLVVALLALSVSGQEKTTGALNITGKLTVSTGPVFIQAVSQVATASTTNVLAYTGNNVAGDLLVLGSVNDSAGQTISTVTDTAGNTWTQATSIVHQFSTKNTELWYTANCAAGANTVTVTYTGSLGSTIVLGEYRGVLKSSPLDKTSTAAAPDGTPQGSADSGNTATTTRGSELLIGVLTIGGTGGGPFTFTAGSSYTIRTQTGNSAQTAGLEDRAVSVTGAYSASGTLSPNAQWAAIIATFKTQ